MRGPPDAIGLVVLLVTGAAGASTGTTRAAMSTTGVQQTTTASAASGAQVLFGFNGTGTGSNGADPYNGLSGFTFSGGAFKGVQTIVIPQAQPAGLGTTTPAMTPPPIVNCSGHIYNGTACPDDGAKGLSVVIIVVIPHTTSSNTGRR